MKASTMVAPESAGAVTISYDQTLGNQKTPQSSDIVQCITTSKGKGRVIRRSTAAAPRQSSPQLALVSQRYVAARFRLLCMVSLALVTCTLSRRQSNATMLQSAVTLSTVTQVAFLDPGLWQGSRMVGLTAKT